MEELEIFVQSFESHEASVGASSSEEGRERSRRSISDFLLQRSPNGATALHTAVLYNSRDVMLRLIELCPKLVNIPQKGLTTAMYDGE